MYFLGQYLFSNAFQVSQSLSITTGYVIPCFSSDNSTFCLSFSNSNSGECIPIINKPSSEYLSFHAVMYGNVLMQLMQEYVQISYSITLSLICSSNSSGVVLM